MVIAKMTAILMVEQISLERQNAGLSELELHLMDHKEIGMLHAIFSLSPPHPRIENKNPKIHQGHHGE